MPSTFSNLVALLAFSVIRAEAFQPYKQAPVVRSPSLSFLSTPTPTPPSASALLAGPTKGDSEDFPPPGDDVEYKGDTDWDAEWKKVVDQQKTGGGSGERPGKDFYKSDAERTAIKSVNTVVERVNKAADSVPRVQAPSMRSLQGDWKFWIALLAIISIGSSLLAASGQNASQFANDPSSYYI